MDIKGKHMDIVDKIDKNDFVIRVRPNKNKRMVHGQAVLT